MARAAEKQTVQSFERSLTRTVGYKYLLALPTGYDSTAETAWPLLLFLHGSGERGDDVWSVAKHGPPKLLRGDTPPPPEETNEQRQQREAASAALAENFIVVSPQCPKGQWWDTAALLALLDEIGATHRIDPRRVYLTGLSMGGYGAWELGLGHPERFAALVAVCGGGSFATAFQSHTHKRHDLRTLAVRVFHGAQDPAVPLAESQRMVDLLKQMKVEDVQLTVYPEAKHDSWTVTYANPELYAWLLRHERAPTAEVK